MSKPAGGKKGGKVQKGKKKGAKKKQIVDPFSKKEWFVVKVPTYMPPGNKHRIGFTPAKKGGAKKQLDARTFIVNLSDLHHPPTDLNPSDEQQPRKFNNKHEWKNFRFVTEETFGDQILTQWDGMEITRDHRCSLIRKWHSMIQCWVDAKTNDGYILRIKALAFTKRQAEQVKKNCYAKNSQRKRIRARMREIIKNYVSNDDLKGFTKRLQDSSIGKDIRKSCQLIFPLKIAMIEKVKVMKKPKKDTARILRLHDLSTGFDPLDADDPAMQQTDGDAPMADGAAGGDGDADESAESQISN